MVLDDKKITNLRGSGAKITGGDGKPAKISTDYLREISAKLTQLLNKEAKETVIPAPVVNIPAPIVNIAPEAEKESKYWKFTLHRDAEGLTTEIIAECQ